MNLVDKAKVFAIRLHGEINHRYDGHPYWLHLEHVVEVAGRYLHLLPSASVEETVLAACWAHDIIEDCRITYNDVKRELGEEVAEIVYALTNEKGKTRKQRASVKYYAGIRATPYATFTKLCDRIANFEYSIEHESKMMEVYAKENTHFLAMLFDKRYYEMAEHLVKLEKSVKTTL